MKIAFTRLVRTASSERYLLHIDGVGDDAALELHYLADGTVAGTLIILDKQYANETQAAAIMEEIDRALLPTVSVEDGNLVFTVVEGRIVGSFTAQSDDEG